MKKSFISGMLLMLCNLCACSKTPPEERSVSIAGESFGLYPSGKRTVEELYYTYNGGNIFGEGGFKTRL